MSFFSKVGSFIGDAFNAVSDIASPIMDFATGSNQFTGSFGLSDLLNLGTSGLSLYNGLTGSNKSLEQQMAYDVFKSNLATEQWKTQFGQRHQLEVDDLRKAGLNPLLSANSAGAVGSFPSGSIPESQSERVRNALQGAQNLLNLKIGNSALKVNETQQLLNGSLSYKANSEADAVVRRADYDGLRTESDIKLQNALAHWYNVQANNASDPVIKYASAIHDISGLAGIGLGALSRRAPFKLGYKPGSRTRRSISDDAKGWIDKDGVVRYF